MKRVPLLPCLILLVTGLQAAEPEALLDALRSEVRTVLKEKKDDKAQKDGQNDLGRSLRYNAEMLLAQIPADDSALKDEQVARTLQVVEQLQAASVSDKADEISSLLAAALKDRISAKQKALKERFEATLRSALANGLSATTAKELDAPLQDLGRLQKELYVFNYRGDSHLMINAESISAVEQILTTIQDAMLAAANPTDKRIREVAERMRSAPSRYGLSLGDIMPRSEFLEKMQAVAARLNPGKALSRLEFEKQLAGIIDGLKKLDQLDEVLGKIGDLVSQQQDVSGYYSDSGVISTLHSYRRLYEDLKAGAGGSINFGSVTSSGGNYEVLRPVTNRLIRYALTRAIGTSGTMAMQDDESIPAYVNRVLESSRRSSDWDLMLRVLDSVQTLGILSIIKSNDSKALRQFLGGVNQQKARQFSGAVTSYFLALRSGSQLVPAEKIGDTLEALKKDHPQDYEAGVQLASSQSYESSGSSRVLSGKSIFPSPATLREHQVLSIPAAKGDAVKQESEAMKPVAPSVSPKSKGSPVKSEPAAKAPAKDPKSAN